MSNSSTNFYASSQAGLAIELTHDDFLNLKSATEMLASMTNLKDIPSDWQRISTDFETIKKDVDYKKKFQAIGVLRDQVNADEPDIRKIHQATKQILKYGTLNMKTTKSQKNIKEGLADLAAEAETDHELQMARSQLYKTAKYAIKLHEMLKGSTDLEAWQAAKIVKASDYLSSVFHSLDYKINVHTSSLQTETKKKTTKRRFDEKKYSAKLHKKLAEMKHNMDPIGIGYFKITKKPGGFFRITVGSGPEGLTSRNAVYLSGDLRSNQLQKELDSVKQHMNLKYMKPYDDKSDKILNS